MNNSNSEIKNGSVQISSENFNKLKEILAQMNISFETLGLDPNLIPQSETKIEIETETLELIPQTEISNLISMNNDDLDSIISEELDESNNIMNKFNDDTDNENNDEDENDENDENENDENDENDEIDEEDEEDEEDENDEEDKNEDENENENQIGKQNNMFDIQQIDIELDLSSDNEINELDIENYDDLTLSSKMKDSINLNSNDESKGTYNFELKKFQTSQFQLDPKKNNTIQLVPKTIQIQPNIASLY